MVVGGLKTLVLPQISVAGLAVMDSNLGRYPYDYKRVSFTEISASTEVPRSEMRPKVTVLDGRERDKLLDNALMVRCALMASIWGVEQMLPEASRSCCGAVVFRKP
ncbi:Lon protease [Gossypium arboreum]|uniref:Lon protease n=1 Tax=Gossypium arboreum TaxID=29729 RepID=A0A0B0PUR2_GOSAR|nr:Lon protease [Gossypium arboreum]